MKMKTDLIYVHIQLINIVLCFSEIYVHVITGVVEKTKSQLDNLEL